MRWQQIDHEPAKPLQSWSPPRRSWLARLLFPMRGRCTVCHTGVPQDEEVCPDCARDLAW